MIREAARKVMKDNLAVLMSSAVLYMICVNLPVVIINQITGLNSFYQSLTDEYIAFLENPSDSALEGLALSYSGWTNMLIAPLIFMIFIPGPLTLGQSSIWLRTLRGHKAYTDMVFSGFSNFIYTVVMDFLRRLIDRKSVV